MNQKLIQSDDRNDFVAKLNEALEDGWRAVPGTHAAALCSGHVDDITSYFGIVVEKGDYQEKEDYFNGVVDGIRSAGYESNDIYKMLVEDHNCDRAFAQELCSLENEDIPEL